MQLQLHRSGVGRASFVLLGSFAAVVLLVLLLWLVLIIVIVVVEPNCDTAILRPLAAAWLLVHPCWLLAAGAVVPRGLACRGDVLYRKFAASSTRTWVCGEEGRKY